MPSIYATATGKVILCGEHAVVYGAPAIALPVFQVSSKTSIFVKPAIVQGAVTILAPNIQLNKKLDEIEAATPYSVAIRLVKEALGVSRLPSCEIHIHSSIPLGAGLGSSASVIVSLVRALGLFLGHPLDNETVNRIAFEAEKITHGKPSGIDNTVISYEKPVFFQSNQPIQLLQILHGFTLVIADSGTSSLTVKTVSGVRKRRQANPDVYDNIISNIGEISREIKRVLQTAELTSNGSLLTMNHNLLTQLGVSTPKLDALVKTSLDAGASGAKLSGGGGGGNIIAVTEPENAAKVARELEAHGAVRTIITTIPAAGEQV